MSSSRSLPDCASLTDAVWRSPNERLVVLLSASDALERYATYVETIFHVQSRCLYAVPAAARARQTARLLRHGDAWLDRSTRKEMADAAEWIRALSSTNGQPHAFDLGLWACAMENALAVLEV
jgi:hypothetical protein